MSKIIELFQPVHTIVGKGSVGRVPEFIGKLGVKKALIVTDQGLVKVGTVKMVTDVLDAHGLAYEIYDRVLPNPSVAIVNESTAMYKEKGCDYLIGVGGGSPIDVAKAISILTANGGKIEDYDGLSKSKKAGSPIIAINTTAGTGSEVTRAYVVTDEVRKAKMLMVDGNSLAYLAVDDPELMVGMPPALTAATGMDALTHAIEGYVANEANPYSDAIAIKAISLIGKSLRTAVNEGTNIEARTDMCWAAYMGGFAFSNSGLGIVHAIAHQLGGVYNTPHGVANAILLPHGMEFNRPYCVERMADIAAALGVDTSNMTTEEASMAAIEAVRQLSKDIKIPSLASTDFNVKDLDLLADNALRDTSMPTNPVQPTKDQLKKLMITAYIEGITQDVLEKLQ